MGLETHELMSRLRARHNGSDFAILTEVGDSTGFPGQRRWADALTMCVWPSRGLEIHGFELKVSRSDWTKELSDPGKAEKICRYCDRWFVVIGDRAIVKDGELPRTWGLIVPHGDGLKVSVPAPKLEPIPLDRKFVAALFRRASEQSVDAAVLKAEYDKGWAASVAHYDKAEDRKAKQFEKRLIELNETVAEFEKASGVRIRDHWMGERIGEAVRTVVNGNHKSELRDLLRAKRAALNILEAIKPLEADLEKFETQA